MTARARPVGRDRREDLESISMEAGYPPRRQLHSSGWAPSPAPSAVLGVSGRRVPRSREWPVPRHWRRRRRLRRRTPRCPARRRSRSPRPARPAGRSVRVRCRRACRSHRWKPWSLDLRWGSRRRRRRPDGSGPRSARRSRRRPGHRETQRVIRLDVRFLLRQAIVERLASSRMAAAYRVAGNPCLPLFGESPSAVAMLRAVPAATVPTGEHRCDRARQRRSPPGADASPVRPRNAARGDGPPLAGAHAAAAQIPG
jgi:hypothetical protein